MYLRSDEGDPGYSTRNPDYAGPEDAKIEYRLENGQVDEYPAAWNIPTPEALRALAHFSSQTSNGHHGSFGTKVKPVVFAPR